MEKNMSRYSRFAFATLLGITLVLLSAQGVMAQSDKAFIDYRQKVMKSLSANTGAIADILKNKLPLGGNIAGHARSIGEAAAIIPSAFDKRITDGPTDAKVSVWGDWDDFRRKAEDLRKAAEDMVKAAGTSDPGAIGAAMKGIGEACKGCHKEFRKPKEESYKKKM